MTPETGLAFQEVWRRFEASNSLYLKGIIAIIIFSLFGINAMNSPVLKT